ncbi:putative disease resistance protein [Senna tora]|uniref:Putative disease resistance protein n=1 Tax=Senna tora TaxID=362788 RepID=A0A834X1M5_9FABA|nr:putative disease resistance protein [Senna tora]
MSRRGGRPKSEIWEHVTKLDGKRVRCNHCGFEFAESAHRIKSHLSQTKYNGIRSCTQFAQPKTTLHSNQRDNSESSSKNVEEDLITLQGEQQKCKQVGPFFVSNMLDQPDLKLIQYAFNMSLDQREIVFSSAYSYLNRFEFTTLKPKSLLDSQVIDTLVENLTNIERKKKNRPLNWYLPVTFSIFIPIHVQKNAQGHFYLYIVDLKKQEVQILDSLSQFIDKKDRDKTTQKLLLALDELFIDDITGKSGTFTKFHVTISEGVLSQSNEYDCGIFVVNFMQQSDNYVNKIPSFQFHSDEERLDLALKLLKSDLNMERERLYDAAKHQYEHGRDQEDHLDSSGIKRKRVDTCKAFSKDVEIKSADITELSYSHISFRNNNVGMEKGHTKGYPIPTTDIIGQKFEGYKDQIWKWVMEDEVSIIGVWGMGGVGKTALVTHIHNMLLQEHDASEYDHIIWVTVSQNYSIYELQRIIARSIDLDISEEYEAKRIAGILLHAFKKMKKCVVVLDDVWDYISLEEVGFPALNQAGIKLILTSRSWEVCQSMNCKHNIITMETLSYGDALNLFKKTLGVFETLPSEVKDLAKGVMQQCEGLPLAIITIARSMKGKQDLREWKHMYGSLCNLENGQYDMDKWVFPVLRRSYDHLTNKKLQEYFLYCAVCNHRSFIFENWFDERKSLEEKYNEVHSLIKKLKNNSLLLEGTYGSEFEFHSMVKGMGVSIVKENHKIMESTYRCLTKIPHESEWTKELEQVFLMGNDIAEISDGISPRCSKLSTLLLDWNTSLKFICDDFFINMPTLRVLDLSHTSIECLPKSISNLESLVALLLSYCESLKNVPSLANLQRLISLDLSHTAISEAPHGLELLINLRSLNLLGTVQLKMSTASIIPKLTKLQCLYLNCIAESMDVRAQDLQVLKELENVSVNFCDVQEFNAYMKSHLHHCGLKSYYFYLSKEKTSPSKFIGDPSNEGMKMVRLVGIELEYLCCLSPFSHLKDLSIERCNSIKKLLTPELSAQLQNLERLSVEKCGSLKEIFSITSGDEEEDDDEDYCYINPFEDIISVPKLEFLRLEDLPELNFVCKGILLCHSPLRLDFGRCPKLLLPPQMEKMMPNCIPVITYF